MPELRSAYPLRTIFATAWRLARHGARCFGGRPVAYLAASLRQAWVEARDMAATVTAQRQRVLAEVERVRFEFSPLGVARRRRAETQLEAELRAHRAEMAARTAAYRARWGSGAVAAPRAA